MPWGHWTSQSTANTVHAARPVPLAWHGNVDAESNQQLWKMYSSGRCPCQGTTTNYSGHISFGAASCGFHQHWDRDGTRPTTTHSECIGPLWPLHKTHYGVCDSWSDCKNCCLIFVVRIHLNLWSIGQTPEWLRSQLWKQHHQWAVGAHGHLDSKNFAILPPD